MLNILKNEKDYQVPIQITLSQWKGIFKINGRYIIDKWDKGTGKVSLQVLWKYE